MRVPSRSRMIWEILSCCGGGRGEEGTAVVTAWASSLDSIIMVATASKLRCSLLLLLCRCGLAAVPSPWRICPTNAPWIKRYKNKPPAGDTCSSGPTECQFLLLLPVWAFALLSFPTHFFLVFLLLLLHMSPFSKLWDTLPFSCSWSLMCIDKAMIDKGQHCLPFSCPEFVQGLVDFDEDLASVLASNCITLKHRICACTLHPWDMDTLHMDFPLCNSSPSLSASLSYT